MPNLSDLFPTPDPEAWRELALKSLRGDGFERLLSKTADGITVQPLYVARPEAKVTLARRGPTADAARSWDLRAPISPPDPATANGQALEALQGGAASLRLTLDPSGETGVAVGDLDHLAAALDGVLLDLAPVALEAGFMGPQAANWLAVLAKGAPLAPLAFDLDPISAFMATGRSPGPIEAHINAAAQTAARHAGAYAEASLFRASGQGVHEAGGTNVQMLAVMAAATVAYLRALTETGMSADAALRRISLGIATDARYPYGIATVRAARSLWQRIAAACGSNAPVRIEVRASRRMLTAKGAWNNLLRQTAAVFAAAAGGADIVTLDPFTQPLGGGNALARRQSRNIQLVLMEEAGIGRVADPAGGAYFFEAMTDKLAREAWALFQKIEGEGGLAAALISGWLQDEIAASRDALLAAAGDGSMPLLGVNLFPDAEERAPTLDAAPHASVAPPDLSQAGPDSVCAPLTPIRLSSALEAA